MLKEKPENKENIFAGNEWVLPTDIKLVDVAEEAFASRIMEAGWEDPVPFQLAFREALVNAIAHGNLEVNSDNGTNILTLAEEKQKENPTDKKVFVTVDITPEKISATVRDEGRGYDWRNYSKDDLFKPHGNGNIIMNSYFDSVTRNEKGNEVTMVKHRQ